jgi:hypothetical protein
MDGRPSGRDSLTELPIQNAYKRVSVTCLQYANLPVFRQKGKI